MEIVIGLLILMCIVVGCGAFIGIIVPIPRLGLKTRKRALGILALSVVGLIVAGGFAPESDRKSHESAANSSSSEERSEQELDRTATPETDHNILASDEPALVGEQSEPQSEAGSTSESEVAVQLEKRPTNDSASVNEQPEPRLKDNDAPKPEDPDPRRGKLVAAWELMLSPETKIKDELIYRDGKMILEGQLSDGGSLTRELIEHPTERTGERKFDLDEADRSEYFTLSDTGVVKFFSWEGRQFATALTTFADPAAMTIGSNVQVRVCVPKQLSASAVEVVRLYEQLHAFKDDPDFARMGFAQAGPYNIWLETIKSHHQGDDAAEALGELGFLAGDVMMLGLDYMGVATRPGTNEGTLRSIEGTERIIQAGLTLAKCTQNDPETKEDTPDPDGSTFSRTGSVHNGVGQECTYTQTYEETNPHFMRASMQHTTRQDVRTIQFDNPECMKNISVNKIPHLMINNTVSDWIIRTYVKKDAAFDTRNLHHPGEDQARGFCIQSKSYPSKGIAIEYLYTSDGDSITGVIYMLALGGCGERI